MAKAHRSALAALLGRETRGTIPSVTPFPYDRPCPIGFAAGCTIVVLARACHQAPIDLAGRLLAGLRNVELGDAIAIYEQSLEPDCIEPHPIEVALLRGLLLGREVTVHAHPVVSMPAALEKLGWMACSQLRDDNELLGDELWSCARHSFSKREIWISIWQKDAPSCPAVVVSNANLDVTDLGLSPVPKTIQAAVLRQLPAALRRSSPEVTAHDMMALERFIREQA